MLVPTCTACQSEIDLLRLVVDLAEREISFSERRQQLVTSIAEQLHASAGMWAWGTCRPDIDAPITVAAIPFGFAADELAVLQQFSLSEKSLHEFQLPLLAQLNPNDGILCATRRDLVSDAEWNSTNWIWQSVHSIGKDSWLHSVRYGNSEIWSSLLLFRDVGLDDFDAKESALVRRAMNGVRWLWAEECVSLAFPNQKQLTARQRTVLWMLLSGLPRKQVARRLEISEDTVDNHATAIFSHFDVTSTIELAALFLRSK